MFITLLIVALYGSQVQSLPNLNSTVGQTIEHGEHLECNPTNWYDVTVFFVGNYLAHAATVKSYPGEGTTSMCIASLGALLIPTSGLIRGLNAIIRNAKFKHKGFIAAMIRDPDYHTAAASGGLCMVVRKKSWKPYPGDKLRDVILRDKSREQPCSRWEERKKTVLKKLKAHFFYNIEPLPKDQSVPDPPRVLKVYRGPWTEERARWWGYTDTAEEYVNPAKTIHGFYDFKDQAWSYTLAHVPRDAVISVGADADNISPRRLESASTGSSQVTQSTTKCESRPPTVARIESSQETPYPVIAASYSLPKALIAIVQLAFAVVTLYQSRGDQINQYGYAAFALTVIPYALMSLVNLAGNLLTPDYHALYLVGSDIMDEAINRGARFDGVVGRLVQKADSSSATAEVLTLSSKDVMVQLSYHNQKERKIFPVTVVDYSSPELPMRQRRKHVADIIERTYRDLSPSIFIPTCSSFLRHNQYNYPTTTSRTQMTSQGTFSLTSVAPSGWRTIICFLNAFVVLSIIGGLTKFQHGTKASNSQLEWILHWYIFGTVYSGYGIEDLIQWRRWPEPDMGPPSKRRVLLMACPLVFYGVPAFGGFVVVVQMLYQYGTCSFN